MPIKNELKKSICFPNITAKQIFDNYFDILAEINNTSASNELSKYFLNCVLPHNDRCKQWAIALLSNRQQGINIAVEDIYQFYAACPWEVKNSNMLKSLYDFTTEAYHLPGGNDLNFDGEYHYFFDTYSMLLAQIVQLEEIEDEEEFMRCLFALKPEWHYLKTGIHYAKMGNPNEFFRYRDCMNTLFYIIRFWWEKIYNNTYLYRLLASITRMQIFMRKENQTIDLLEKIKALEKEIEE